MNITRNHGQPTNTRAAAILADYVNSDCTEAQALASLDVLGVRGAFRDDDSFCGYDYREQAWIDTQAADPADENRLPLPTWAV